MESNSWLLLLYGLPTRNTAERVKLWRKRKKYGARQLKTSAYVLPDAGDGPQTTSGRAADGGIER